MSLKKSNGIGTLHESSLHAALKEIYSNEGDIIEAYSIELETPR